MQSIQYCPALLIGMLLLVPLSSQMRGAGKPAKEYLVYFGTYTGKGSKGIYSCRFHPSTGKLTPVQLAGETSSPSFLAIDPSSRYLFAANESDSDPALKDGAVTGFSIDRKTGKLTSLNAVTSRGAGPCHLTVSKNGRNVLVANYVGGSVAVMPVKADGMLGESSDFKQHLGSSVDKSRQSEPHAHSVVLTPDNRFAVVADLGLDKLLVYRFDPEKGTLTPNDPPAGHVKPGSGPRHFAFHPNGRFGYVINEMGNTVTAFDWDGERGTFNEIQNITTLPKDFHGENSTAEIEVHPSGRFLYGSNRGHDSIVVYAIDPAKGTLTFVEDVLTEGKEPRNFALDPTGKYLFAANQNSDTVAVFRVNPKNGRLTFTGQKFEVPSPVCVTFVAAE
ncbi:MAG: lactonase family protein [Bryobacteraceae bacterium]